MIEAFINDEPSVMALFAPLANIYMGIGKESVMLIHQSLHANANTLCIYDSSTPSARTLKISKVIAET